MAALSVKAHYQGFLVFAALFTEFVCVDYRRKNLEAKSLVIERCNGAPNHHIGQFAHGLARYFVAFRHRRTGEITGDPGRGWRIDIEDDPAFDVTLDRYQGS